MDEIVTKRDAIHALVNVYKAENLWLFGSCARREERPDSDVDFLVKFGSSREQGLQGGSCDMRSGGANYRGEDKFVHMMRAIGRIKGHLDGLERFHVRFQSWNLKKKGYSP